MGYMMREFNSLVHNVLNGVRTALFFPHAVEDFHSSHDQAVWLVLFNALLALGYGYVTHLPHPDFSVYGVFPQLWSLGAVLLATFLVAKTLRDPAASTRLMVAIYSISPEFFLIYRALQAWVTPSYAASVDGLPYQYLLVYGWALAVILFVIVKLSDRRYARAAAGFGTYLVFAIAPALMTPHWEFWHTQHRNTNDAVYRRLYDERALYLQDDLMHKVAEHLRKGRPHHVDVYFLGFAGYSGQDVFMKEVEYAKQLFQTRFDAWGRTVTLINNVKTEPTTPLATRTNLVMALDDIGRAMNPEDFLFLYMTSHGSPSHRLAVDMWPYNLAQISPPDLRKLLDQAGIKNRVLMISACFSGGFVKPLENPNTVVVTAAAANRESFGCSAERNFTYFGDALLAGQLGHETSLIHAFRSAIHAIHVRERREHKTPSDPQLFIGRNMRAKLKTLEAVLAADRASRAPHSS